MTCSLESAGALAVSMFFCVSKSPPRYAPFRRFVMGIRPVGESAWLEGLELNVHTAVGAAVGVLYSRVAEA